MVRSSSKSSLRAWHSNCENFINSCTPAVESCVLWCKPLRMSFLTNKFKSLITVKGSCVDVGQKPKPSARTSFFTSVFRLSLQFCNVRLECFETSLVPPGELLKKQSQVRCLNWEWLG